MKIQFPVLRFLAVLWFVISASHGSLLAQDASPSGVITGGRQGVYDSGRAEELRVRDGLPNLFAKLESGETVRVGYMGGSITRAEGWRPQTFDWFKQQYPDADLQQIDIAVSGTGSAFGACRTATDLLRQKPDMVFIEFRVNLGRAFPGRAIEGIVRQILKDNPATDICFVYTIGEWMLKDLKQGNQYWFGREMENVANAYGIPTIDMGVEVIEQLKNEQLVFKANASAEGKLVFSKDGVHPGEDGHKLYTQVITRSLETIRDHPARKPGPRPMPEPFDPLHLENATLMSIHQAKKSSGWKTVNPETDPIYRKDQRRSRQMLRDAIRCETVGESVEIDWSGIMIGLTHIPQGTGMEIEVSIDDGPNRTYEFQQESEKNLYAKFQYLAEQSPGKHTAKITVSKLPEGTVFYLGQVMVIR